MRPAPGLVPARDHRRAPADPRALALLVLSAAAGVALVLLATAVFIQAIR